MNSDPKVIGFSPKKTPGVPAAPHHPRVVPESVFFTRREFEKILNIYGRMVAAGHWKDYAIDSDRKTAVFSVYQNMQDHPLYQIVKEPARAQKQGAFLISAARGRILKRGHDLETLLGYFTGTRLKRIR